MMVQDRVAGFLLFNQNREFCDACLAAVTDSPLDEVTKFVANLSTRPAFLRDRWRCSRCHRGTMVIRALPNRVIARSGASLRFASRPEGSIARRSAASG